MSGVSLISGQGSETRNQSWVLLIHISVSSSPVHVVCQQLSKQSKLKKKLVEGLKKFKTMNFSNFTRNDLKCFWNSVFFWLAPLKSRWEGHLQWKIQFYMFFCNCFETFSLELLASNSPWCSIELTSRMKRNKVEQPRTVQRVQCRAARQREQHLHWRRSFYIYIWNNDVMTEVSCSSGHTGLLQTNLLHDPPLHWASHPPLTA